MSGNSWDNDWIVFSRKARRGAFVLLFAFVLIAVTPRIYRNYFMDTPLDVQIASLDMGEEKTNEPNYQVNSNKQTDSEKDNISEEKSFSYNIPVEKFNPNTYGFEDWKAIGFSKKQVQTILNYRKSLGKFKVKDDVKKLFVVDDELYAQLYDVIDLPDSLKSIEKENPALDPKIKRKAAININTASMEELKEVSGVGPFFAEEIIKLREGYGGIHHINQLLEIYRMDEEKLSIIKKSFIIENKDIRKMNINEATRKELNEHKAISWNIANSIVTMRETHGVYKKIDDLLMSILIDRDKLETLKPYLTVK